MLSCSLTTVCPRSSIFVFWLLQNLSEVYHQMYAVVVIQLLPCSVLLLLFYLLLQVLHLLCKDQTELNSNYPTNRKGSKIKLNGM